MFAVIKTGGKQYKVAKDDVIAVETLAGAPGETVELSDVLMLGADGEAPTVGAPLVEKAAVFAEVIDQTKGEKIIVFKKKRRQGYRRKTGHRQHLTVLRITEISATGEKPAAAKAAAPKAEPKAAPKAEAEDKPKAEAAPKKAAPAKKAEAKAAPKKEAAAKPKAAAKTESKPKAAKSGTKTTAESKE